MNGFANALISATSTDVGHGHIDVFVGWLGFAFEQSHCRHDLTRLAVSALGHIHLGPSFLNRMAAAV